jgi:hypothetical protein
LADHHAAHQTSEAYVVSVCEDFCKTPTAPVGYMLYQQLAVSHAVCDSVHGCGTPVLNTASRISSVLGNEAGVGGGVVSGVNVGLCRPVLSQAKRVRAEGQFLLRNDTVMEMNMCSADGPGNAVGKIVYCSAGPAPPSPDPNEFEYGKYPSDHPLDIDWNDLSHMAGFFINLPVALLLKGVSLLFPDVGVWLKETLPETAFGTQDNTGAGHLVGNNMKGVDGPPGVFGIAMALVHAESFWGDGAKFEKDGLNHDFWTGRGQKSDAVDSAGDTLGQGFGVLARKLGVGDEFYQAVSFLLGERDGYGFVQGVFNGSRPPI